VKINGGKVDGQGKDLFENPIVGEKQERRLALKFRKDLSREKKCAEKTNDPKETNEGGQKKNPGEEKRKGRLKRVSPPKRPKSLSPPGEAPFSLLCKRNDKICSALQKKEDERGVGGSGKKWCRV